MATFSGHDDRTAQLLIEAYGAAWQHLETTAHPWATHAATKARLTRGLLAAAAQGERDPIKLKLAALKSV